MKILELLTEIDHDDSVYTKAQSDSVMNFKIDKTWAPLMELDDVQVFWKEHHKAFYVAALDKNNSPIIRLELKPKTVKVPGGTLTGVITESLSSRADARGKGLARKVYEALVLKGQVLFSSDMQTTGSRLLWEKLVQSGVGEPFVLAEGAAARWYSRKYQQHDGTSYVLLTGDFEKLNDEAYASSETRWLILPDDLPGLDTIKDRAITL